MDKIHRALILLARVEPRRDQDFFDRMNHWWTVIFLFIANLLVTTKQFVGEAVNCWTPANFLSTHTRYTDDICWVENTYWLPMNEPIPKRIPERMEREVPYYQYVPLLLATQMLLFILPAFFWKVLMKRSGIRLNHIVRDAREAEIADHEKMKERAAEIAIFIHAHMKSHREHRNGTITRMKQAVARHTPFVCGATYGNFLTALYLIIKLLQVFHLIFELAFLEKLLARNVRSQSRPESGYPFGVRMIRGLLTSDSWEISGHFPLVTWCDFEVRRIGNIHRHSVQCVLPINMFNAKMFFTFWWFYVALTFYGVCNFISWLNLLYFRSSKISWVRKQLQLRATDQKSRDELEDPRIERNLYHFVTYFLRSDGFFVLLMLDTGAGELVTSRVTRHLWDLRAGRKVDIPHRTGWKKRRNRGIEGGSSDE